MIFERLTSELLAKSVWYSRGWKIRNTKGNIPDYLRDTTNLRGLSMRRSQ